MPIRQKRPSTGSHSSSSSPSLSDFPTSYKLFSDFLERSQETPQDCEAHISPGLDEMSSRISKTRNDLSELKERLNVHTDGSSLRTSLPSGSGILVKLKNAFKSERKKVESMNFEDFSDIKDACFRLLADTTNTSSRREGYMALFRLVASHELPDDGVHFPLEVQVTVKEGSYLDSSKYQRSGPMLVLLAQKAINFIVSAQNPGNQLTRYRNDLAEMASDLHQLVLRIICDMRDSPDDINLHIQYINNTENIISDFLATFQYSETFLTDAKGYQQVLREEDRALEILRRSRPMNESTNDISESDDEIVVFVEGQRVIHKKADLSWEYLRNRFIPSLGISMHELPLKDGNSFRGGSFASVDVKILSNGRKVALKYLRTGITDEEILCLRFIREVYIWRKASGHAHIQELIGLYLLNNGLPAMISPWCDGGHLAAYLSHPETQRMLTQKERLKLASQVSEGLAHLHAHNIIHGDLKPDNILLQDGQAKLLDFRISRILDDAKMLSTEIHGHYRYQAPEVLKAKDNDLHSCITTKSDVFSFGRILYQCLTGSIPFSNTSGINTVIQLVYDNQLPINSEYGKEVVGEGKEDCERLMRDCWHKAANPRLSASEVADRLKEIILKLKEG